MTRALLFLLVRSIKNRFLLRLQSLRRPKYLVSILAGLVYLYLVLMQFFVNRPRQRLADDHLLAQAAESGAALLLFVVIVYRWLATTRRGLFSPAEVQFLFVAPLSRRDLLHYHMVKTQPGIVLAAVISSLVLQIGFSLPAALLGFAAIWLIFTFVYFCRVAIFLFKKTLIERGTPDAELRTWMLGVVALAGCAVAVWTKWFAAGVPDQGNQPFSHWAAGFLKAFGSGPAYYLLLPFRIMVRPLWAPDPFQLALRLIPALIILILIYVLIRYSRTDLRQVQTSGNVQSKSRATGRSQGRQNQRTCFKWPLCSGLATAGAPCLAIYWKNLILISKLKLHITLPALAAPIFASLLLASASRDEAFMAVGEVAAILIVFLIFWGPILFAQDLRMDMKSIDLLKSYPIRGSVVVLGEALAPATILSAMQLLLLLIAVAALPGFENFPSHAHDRIFVFIAGAMLVPFLSFLGVLAQNGIVLLLPDWVRLGREHPQGIEAMGQRLMTSMVTAVFLGTVVLPAAILFYAAVRAGYSVLGTAVLPLASLAGAITLSIETCAILRLLGRLYDRFDASYGW